MASGEAEAKPGEEEAGHLLTKVLDGRTFCVRDKPGAPDGTHDLDVVLPDSHVIAVEVTQQTDEKLRKRDEVRRALQWRFPELQKQWRVELRGGRVNIRTLHQQMGRLLRDLEDAGIEQFPIVGQWHIDGPVARLRSLGVSSANAFNPVPFEGQDNPIFYGLLSGPPADPEEVVRVVEDRAREKVQTLLRASTAWRRHLFIWVDPAREHRLAWAIENGELPTRGPALPPEGIDAVWVAAAYRPAPVWLYEGERGWSDLGVVDYVPL